jgi:hypothetical protein
VTYVRIVELSEAGRHAEHEGRAVLRGRSLASLVREFGGYEGAMKAPFTGGLHEVSLLPWCDRDPETTWLDIQFITETSPPTRS